MARSQTFQADGELNVAGANNVLDFEVGELGVEAELLDNTGVFSGRKLRIVLRLGTSDYHLARGEDQSCRLGLANTHDDSGESLGVILGIPGMQGNRLEIQAAIEINRGNDVPLIERDKPHRTESQSVLHYTYCKVGVIPLGP